MIFLFYFMLMKFLILIILITICVYAATVRWIRREYKSGYYSAYNHQ